MTKNTGRKKQKNQLYTLKTRKDYLDVPYANGVFDEKGKQVMRELTPEEFEWMQKFTQETEHVNFQKTEELKKEAKQFKEMKKQYNALKDKKSNDAILLKSRINKKYKELVELRSQTGTFYPEDKDRHELFDRDYERRMDLFNNAKATGNLVSYDITEFDKFVSEAETDVNSEDLVLEHLSEPVKKSKSRSTKRKTFSPDH